ARMSKSDFTSLLREIADNPVFQNRSFRDQASVARQLLVAMANFGLSGNGGQSPIIAKLFSMAEGSVDNYTNRCIYAIVQLQSKYVRWPTAEGWWEIKSAIRSTSFFKDCVRFIDGTLIPLAFAPQKNPEDYYSCKSFYAVNSLMICDHQQRFLYVYHGWCGTAHDQRVLKSTEV
ncbi:hypothetical protein CROQUDRAFT_17723, partial [Cronartium quercuum f. sp. fusiforme G11]